MLTSSFSRRARANRRRKRGNRRLGWAGRRKSSATSVRSPCVEQARDLVLRRGLERRRAPHLAGAGGDAQFVRGDLHRGREIERRERRVRRESSRPAGSVRARHSTGRTSRCRRPARPRRARHRPAPRARRRAPAARRRRTRAAAPRIRSPARRLPAPRRAWRRRAPHAGCRSRRKRARRPRDRESAAAPPASAARDPSCASRARVAPMLPGWLVAHRTMRMRESASFFARGSTTDGSGASVMRVERLRLQVECATIVLYAPPARQRKSGEPECTRCSPPRSRPHAAPAASSIAARAISTGLSSPPRVRRTSSARSIALPKRRLSRRCTPPIPTTRF